MTPPVVDWGRRNRLCVNEPVKFTLTHACLLLILICVMYLFKRFRDNQKQPRV